MREDNQTNTFYITTPIYYVNGEPHIGHAYTTIAADALARFHRLRGEEVYFVTGTDEHGAKVVHTAQEQGQEPQAFVDEIVGSFQKMWERMHVSYDRFIRTTEEAHIKTVQEVFRQLLERGDIYLDEYQGWYCVPCETYLRESELQEGCCPDCGRPVEQVVEPAYFFRASQYEERLLQYIEENPDFIQPVTRRREVVSFLTGGLRDTCVSRAAAGWDIPVPADPDHSVYVWLDALINYLTVVGYPDEGAPQWRYWPPQVQLMAKDILTRFHATFWPALLLALELPLPQVLFAHGWWVTDEGDKISKSKGHVLNPWEVAQDLAEVSGATTRIAADAVRYFLLREVTFGLDGSFSMQALLRRFNADLANDLGNLLNRTLPLLDRYREGQVPEPGPGAGGLAADIKRAGRRLVEEMEGLNFRSALESVWELLAAANKFVDQREPWALHKAAKEVELDAVLYDLADCLRVVAVFISPFMPAVAQEIWQRLGLETAGVEMNWRDCEAGKLPAGVQVEAGKPLFPRVEVDRALQRLESNAEKATAATKPVETKSELISFEEFQKLDLRVGKVIEVDKVPQADKLYRLQVDLGEGDRRQLVAGLAEDFSPEEILGKNVILVANLEPATIRGVRSCGMILAAGAERPLALVVADRDCPPGTQVR